MSRINARRPRIAMLLALALGAVAVLALSGVATAKDRGGDDNGHGHHGNHGRHHHHHFREFEEAGTLSSFDPSTGRLTIALTGAETVSGLVTEETRLRCEGVDDRRIDSRDHGDDNGGRGTEPGDDNGGQGNEPGDDNGGEAPQPGEEAPSCTTAALVPGTAVSDAELRVGGGAATFTEVEIG